jgi:hypothetical protein
MQYHSLPFSWPMPAYLPLPPIIEDNDLFINSVVNGGTGPEGPQGPQGEPGEPGVAVVDAEVTDNPGDLILLLSDGTTINAGQVTGPPGPPGPSGSCECNATTITGDYCATTTDCYIGAQLNTAATVTLPNAVPQGTRYTVKLEFGAPVGTRKLTVRPQPPSLINGVTAITLTTPYESASVIYNNNHYWTI